MFLILLAVGAAHAAVPNMNGEYLIGNPKGVPDPHAPSTFNTNYSSRPNTEYFDVHSHPIATRYGQVYWTQMPPVDLPADIVSRFDNKTMAIVGYEVDQVA